MDVTLGGTQQLAGAGTTVNTCDVTVKAENKQSMSDSLKNVRMLALFQILEIIFEENLFPDAKVKVNVFELYFVQQPDRQSRFSTHVDSV